jgi:hypothetical protein
LLVLTGLLFLTPQPAPAQSSGGPSILARSPFLPPDFQPPGERPQPSRPQPGQQTSFEFRGVYQLGGEYRFLVAESRSGEGDWVALNSASDSLEVRDYDPEAQVLTIFANNKEEQLELAQLNPDTKPMPVQGQTTSQPARARADTQQANTNQPRRRVIRPTSRSNPQPEAGNNNQDQAKAPTPAWLQKLRERAAQRREAARKAREQLQQEQNQQN